ncbi:hypothetical protein ACFW0V_19705 [Micromonospora parva]|uniref:hypothetical protein n=1 Tax=Micromonospora parva TaxID=1464048 RepID=UPI00366A8BE1
MSELARRPRADAASTAATASEVVNDLIRFQDTVLGQLEAVGLPTDGVLVDLDERETLLASLGGALRRLPVQDRGRSLYVSKMIVAAAVGLFDAALNYLWDETVTELRRRVIGYDLGYFYDIAVIGDKRKHYSGADDLPQVQDVDMLRACREIGLLSDVGYLQVDLIRQMRNHASAAHPNHVQLTGLQLASWLDTCIRQVITLPQDPITANTGRLLRNIKSARLDSDQIATTAVFFEELPAERADTLAAGLFGLYTDTKRTSVVADNVRRLWPELWDYVSDEARYSFGTRYGRFQASAETGLATAARELLDLVDAAEYLPEPIRTVEIDKAIDALVAAHTGWDNFYNEVAPAKALEDLVGKGSLPDGVRSKFVRAIVKAFLGNGYGVSGAAIPSYTRLIGSLDPRQAGQALRAFNDPEVSSVLWSSSGRRQWGSLLELLEPKLTRKSDRELYDAIRAFSGTPDQLHVDSGIKRLLAPRRLPSLRRPTK